MHKFTVETPDFRHYNFSSENIESIKNVKKIIAGSDKITELPFVSDKFDKLKEAEDAFIDSFKEVKYAISFISRHISIYYLGKKLTYEEGEEFLKKYRLSYDDLIGETFDWSSLTMFDSIYIFTL